MAANQAASPIPCLLSFDDDDGFGEFKFVPSSPFSSSPLFPDPPNPQPPQEEDDWGDFVVGSQSQSQSVGPPIPSSSPSSPLFDPFPDANCPRDPVAAVPAASGGKWEKPRGAIPLSIFGDDEVEEPEPLDPNTVFGSLAFSSSRSSPFSTPTKGKEDGVGLGSGGGIKDLIADLYGRAGGGAVSNGGADSSDLAPGEDDLDENGWEFKDAFSDAGSVAGLKEEEEEKSKEVPGLERKEAAGTFEFQVVVDRLGSVKGAIGQRRISNDKEEQSFVRSAHDGFTNGFGFDSDVIHNECTVDTSQKTDSIKKGNELHSTLENGYHTVEVKLWELKDAFSENVVVSGSLGQKKPLDAEEKLPVPTNKDQETRDLWENNLGGLHTSYTNGKEDPAPIFSNSSHLVYPTQCPTGNGQNLPELGLQSVSMNGGNGHFDEILWDFQEPSETAVSNKSSAPEIHRSLSNEASQNIFSDLYGRLKEESLVLMVHHLGDLKKAHEVACLSGEQEKILKTDEEIKAAYKKLEEAMISENVYMGKHVDKDVHLDHLIEYLKEHHFQALEQEYNLSERLSLAGKNLSAAIGLSGHATSMLHIMQLASKEEQRAYIIAWSKMALACAQELQHGAMIWNEALSANVCKQLLSQGYSYFVALGEIYRVAKILGASLRLYKPWMLSYQEDSSKVVECLDKCAEAWMSIGLEKALESISAATMYLDHKDVTKTLLLSIKLIDGLDELSLALGHHKMICKLSLLPVDMLKDMKVVTWNGEHYFLKLVNLWTNRVSSDPPQLRVS